MFQSVKSNFTFFPSNFRPPKQLINKIKHFQLETFCKPFFSLILVGDHRAWRLTIPQIGRRVGGLYLGWFENYAIGVRASANAVVSASRVICASDGGPACQPGGTLPGPERLSPARREGRLSGGAPGLCHPGERGAAEREAKLRAARVGPDG